MADQTTYCTLLQTRRHIQQLPLFAEPADAEATIEGLLCRLRERETGQSGAYEDDWSSNGRPAPSNRIAAAPADR